MMRGGYPFFRLIECLCLVYMKYCLHVLNAKYLLNASHPMTIKNVYNFWKLAQGSSLQSCVELFATRTNVTN
jgi:hypothetical protein